jgi:dTMP kinase
MKRGLFIVIDGLGGSGKSTQIELSQKTPQKGRLYQRAGWRTTSGANPRHSQRWRWNRCRPANGFFPFLGGAAEHMTALIKPALMKGKNVFCDRFDSSTFAMQVRGEAQKGMEKFFWECRKATLEKFEPDIYIILDTPHGIAKDRRVSRLDRLGRPKNDDRFDERGESYQNKVRAGLQRIREKSRRACHRLEPRPRRYTRADLGDRLKEAEIERIA